MSEQNCLKHNARLMLRQNAKTKEIALACPYRDAEARGGGEADRKIIRDAMKKANED